jgi:hypothetical protein
MLAGSNKAQVHPRRAENELAGNNIAHGQLSVKDGLTRNGYEEKVEEDSF